MSISSDYDDEHLTIRCRSCKEVYENIRMYYDNDECEGRTAEAI